MRIPEQKFFGQNWLDLGKFGWLDFGEIWAKLRRNLGKTD